MELSVPNLMGLPPFDIFLPHLKTKRFFTIFSSLYLQAWLYSYVSGLAIVGLIPRKIQIKLKFHKNNSGIAPKSIHYRN